MKDERLGQNIREIRKAKGLTQQYIADKVGVTKQTICKIEKGNHATLETINRIAKALYVDVQELYEPINKVKTSPYECQDFLTTDEKNIIIYEFMTPMATCLKDTVARLNDNVARNFAESIRKQCSFSNQQLESLLEDKGYKDKESYTTSELYAICKEMNDKFILKVYSILTDTNTNN